MKRFKSILSVVFLIAGVVMLAYTYNNMYVPNIPPLEQQVNIPFQLDSILRNNKDVIQYDENGFNREKRYPLIALFLLRTNACPGCISEIIDYIDIIQHDVKIDSIIEPIILLKGIDKRRITTLLKLANIPAITYYTTNDSILINPNINEKINYVLFASTNNDKIFYIKELSKGLSKESYKRKTFNKVLSLYFDKNKIN